MRSPCDCYVDQPAAASRRVRGRHAVQRRHDAGRGRRPGGGAVPPERAAPGAARRRGRVLAQDQPGTDHQGQGRLGHLGQGAGQLPASGTLPMTGVLDAPPGPLRGQVRHRRARPRPVPGARRGRRRRDLHAAPARDPHPAQGDPAGGREAQLPHPEAALSAMRTLLALAAAVGLAGCALKTPPDPAELRRQALPNLQVPETWASHSALGGSVQEGWLATFQRPDAQPAGRGGARLQRRSARGRRARGAGRRLRARRRRPGCILPSTCSRAAAAR